MTIQYIKSLIDDKIIYKQQNIKNETLILSPYNGITDTDEDYYNHLNNVLNPGLYLIKYCNNTYILLINKYIYQISKNQLIILNRLLSCFDKNSITVFKKLQKININLTNPNPDFNIFCEKILTNQKIISELKYQLKSINCIKPSDIRCCLLFLIFIIDSLLEIYKLVKPSMQQTIKLILNYIINTDLINAKKYIFDLFYTFNIYDKSISIFTNQIIFAINKIYKLKKS